MESEAGDDSEEYLPRPAGGVGAPSSSPKLGLVNVDSPPGPSNTPAQSKGALSAPSPRRSIHQPPEDVGSLPDGRSPVDPPSNADASFAAPPFAACTPLALCTSSPRLANPPRITFSMFSSNALEYSGVPIFFVLVNSLATSMSGGSEGEEVASPADFGITCGDPVPSLDEDVLLTVGAAPAAAAASLAFLSAAFFVAEFASCACRNASLNS